MTEEVFKAGVRAFLEESISTLKAASTIWPLHYEPEANESSPQRDESKTDPKDPEHNTIYASGDGKSGFKLSIQQRFYGLFEERIGLDIDVVVGQEEVVFQAHKIVLASASPFLYSAIYGGLRNVKRLKIPDCQPEAFRVILKYIYTGEYDLVQCFETAMLVIHVAKKLGIPEFVKNIYDFFLANVTQKNVLNLFNSPYHLHLPKRKSDHLELICLDIIENHTSQVLSHGLHKIDLRKLCSILRNDSLKIEEIELFEFVYKWSRLECERQELELTPQNIRRVGDEAFRLVRIPTISSEDFENIIIPAKVLTKGEVSRIVNWKKSDGGPFLPGIDFSTRVRIGGIPGMTDFPALQYEFGNLHAGGDPGDMEEFPTGVFVSNGSFRSRDPETLFTQQKLERLIKLLQGTTEAAASVVGKSVEAKNRIDAIFQEVAAQDELNSKLIPENGLD